VNVDRLLEALRERLPAEVPEPQVVPMNEVFVELPSDCLHQAVQVLVERFDLRHLSAITGQDIGSEIELLYHFWERGHISPP